MRTAHLSVRMSWLGPMCCVVLALLLAGPATALASPIYVTTLTGANEVGPTGSPATGFAQVTLNGNTLTVDEVSSGLVGGAAAAAHIHCCVPAGTNTGAAVPFVGFPPATSGTYSHTFDLTLDSTYTAAFETAS